MSTKFCCSLPTKNKTLTNQALKCKCNGNKEIWNHDLIIQLLCLVSLNRSVDISHTPCIYNIKEAIQLLGTYIPPTSDSLSSVLWLHGIRGCRVSASFHSAKSAATGTSIPKKHDGCGCNTIPTSIPTLPKTLILHIKQRITLCYHSNILLEALNQNKQRQN